MKYPKKGVRLEDILKYVLRYTKMSESRALYLIIEILKLGIVKGRIEKLPGNLYALAKCRPGPIGKKIHEPDFDDDSSDTSTDLF
ncbi:hypothetical protein M0802_005766 [Mischocyttarus mexicanus]|nr:hypothetical protein M0802_005766 [Mischocyttarus mexicanus]